jgi:hypothetical protein
MTISTSILNARRVCQVVPGDAPRVHPTAQKPVLLEGRLPDRNPESGLTEVYALGHTHRGRLLFAVFTIRRRRIRVISARDMTKREREIYRSHG